MEYRKESDGLFSKLPQKNVDFGGGLERITAAANNQPDIFRIDVFQTAINNLEIYTENKYLEEESKKSYRIILDHVRGAVFLMADGIMPSNTEKGYFVRRLLRRAILHLDKLKMEGNQLHNPLDSIINSYKKHYPNLLNNKKEIEDTLNKEEQQFRKTLETGLREFEKMSKGDISGKNAFILFSTYGFPIEMTMELARERGLSVDLEVFKDEMKKHQDISRAGSEQKFKGGLGDTSEMSIKYHTATHLLHQALRMVLGDHVTQKGSNITPERLRFDFSHPQKMTDEEKKKVEDIVNQKIKEALPVQNIILPKEEALKTGALHFFGEKYGDDVSVYFIGNSIQNAFSKEFCGGPHVISTDMIGRGTDSEGNPRNDLTFKIVKEEAVSAGIRRIKAILE